MPRYLTIFHPDVMGQPTQEQMQAMGAYMEKETKRGALVIGGGMKKREADGLRVSRKGETYKVENGGAPWAAAAGFAILEAPSREALIEDVKTFLGLAGEGVSEIIEIT